MTRVEIAAPAFVQATPDPGGLVVERYHLHIPGGFSYSLFPSAAGQWVLSGMGGKDNLGPCEVLNLRDARRIAVKRLLTHFEILRRHKAKVRWAKRIPLAITALERLRELYPDPEPS